MMLNPTPTTPTALDAENIEPWITFLIERLGDYWPWLKEATPKQIQLLAGAIAAIINRITSRHTLQTEAKPDPTAIKQEVEEILHTMKPERVQ